MSRPSPRLKKKKPSAKKKSLPVQKRKDNVTPRRHDSLVFLGPTTYNVLEPEAPLLHIQGPNEGFLSTSERMKPDAFVTPPPNSYNVSEYRAHRVQGGNSLQYRSKRLTADDHEAKKSPGPATYQRETRATPREGVGKIIRGRPPRLGPKEGPSIPSGRGVFGFEIDNTGEVAKLVPVLIKESDKLPSPTEKYEGGEKYKGIFWSKRTAQRDSTEDEKLNISPGPAAYSLEKPPPTFREKMDKYIKDINKKYANLPRYLEKEQQAIIKENIPSPSAYDISIKTKINLKKDGSKLGTFGNTTRFKTVIKEGPGPGYYEENRKICAKEFCYSANKLKTVKDIPFLTTEKRFEKLVKEEVISNIEHCKRDNVKLINYWVEEGKKKAAFSSTEPRFKLDFPESPGSFF
ncbi:sperm-tail PG-rich repeat-containing protein 2-like [Lycorma delicatula]|uniref:sperm-tail PG-rich repeat-containing protein 2-like n=1 Tax=Lycorma delicatula TaxID=130591 RepID=UPI003F5196ED